MGLLGWLDRIAGRFNRKATPTAAVVAAESAPSAMTPVAAAEVEKEEAEEIGTEE
jgi:hypothetical protein